MELPLVCPAQCKIRACIHFFNAQGTKPAEIHRQLTKVYGAECITVRHIRKWCHLFSDRRENTHDETKSGRPLEVVNFDTITAVHTLIEHKCRKTIENIRTELIEKHHINISHDSIHSINHDVLFRKVCTRWVLWSLSEEHRKNRMGAALDLLTCYE